MSIKYIVSKLSLTILTAGAAALLMTACQKEEPKEPTSPFDNMGDSMQKASKDMEKAAEKAAEELDQAAKKAKKEAEKAAAEAEKAAAEATQ